MKAPSLIIKPGLLTICYKDCGWRAAIALLCRECSYGSHRGLQHRSFGFRAASVVIALATTAIQTMNQSSTKVRVEKVAAKFGVTRRTNQIKI
jgi:hypothetical protein